MVGYFYHIFDFKELILLLIRDAVEKCTTKIDIKSENNIEKPIFCATPGGDNTFLAPFTNEPLSKVSQSTFESGRFNVSSLSFALRIVMLKHLYWRKWRFVL